MIRALAHLVGLFAAAFLGLMVYLLPLFTIPVKPFTGIRLAMLIGLAAVSMVGHLYEYFMACSNVAKGAKKSE